MNIASTSDTFQRCARQTLYARQTISASQTEPSLRANARPVISANIRPSLPRDTGPSTRQNVFDAISIALASETTSATSTAASAASASTAVWDEAGLERTYTSIRETLPRAVKALPTAVQGGVLSALEKSLGRIKEALTEGRINQGEAEQALEMMREMSEALTDLAQHQLTVVEQSGSGDDGNVEVARLRANDKDELVLVTRKAADDAGEARISLRMVMDDGEEIPSRYRLGLRIDLERRGTPSIDVQFGESALDKRVHGIWRDTDGRPVLTATGAQLADHHFRGELPASLANPADFEAMVVAFRASTGDQANAAVSSTAG